MRVGLLNRLHLFSEDAVVAVRVFLGQCMEASILLLLHDVHAFLCEMGNIVLLDNPRNDQPS